MYHRLLCFPDSVHGKHCFGRNDCPTTTAAPAALKSIEIAHAPNKIDYLIGEELDDTQHRHQRHYE